jgi:hypothetical protein
MDLADLTFSGTKDWDSPPKIVEGFSSLAWQNGSLTAAISGPSPELKYHLHLLLMFQFHL